MPHIAKLNIQIEMNDDVSLDVRVKWVASAIPLIAKALHALDAEPRIELGLSEEEKDALEEHFNKSDDEALKKGFRQQATRTEDAEENDAPLH